MFWAECFGALTLVCGSAVHVDVAFLQGTSSGLSYGLNVGIGSSGLRGHLYLNAYLRGHKALLGKQNPKP